MREIFPELGNTCSSYLLICVCRGGTLMYYFSRFLILSRIRSKSFEFRVLWRCVSEVESFVRFMN